MKKIIVAIALSCAIAPAFAEKSCTELKSEITKKIEAKGVKKYQVEIVDAADIKDQKVIGSCEKGKKKILYKKG